MGLTRAELLTAVERSPQAAAAHDRAGWVGLFADGGRIEDPVGSRPHRGPAEIAQFYDTFIGPRDITFHRDVDIVAGDTVIRDLELEVAMGAADGAAVTMRIPAYLRYALEPELGDGPDRARITELQAYWELPAMVLQFLRHGTRAVPVGLQLAGALLRNQGPVGAVGFAAGFRGVGARPPSHSRRRFTGLLDNLCAGDEVSVRRKLRRDARVLSGEATPLGASKLTAMTVGGCWRKVIVSGASAVAGIDTRSGRAVLIAELTPNGIRRVRYFTDAAARQG
ncbi:nuclear transport factor 2 family protein [Mycolicibacterium goodii]|uniref:SnoaL-like domain-containing protein n=1 Tax=Mycolicibacterium goodii TaxID=134601 RepID=A0A0K0X9C5_MYCGD|nr:hypothetical protein AFA91_21485 [Mycolicibacterium goodii]